MAEAKDQLDTDLLSSAQEANVARKRKAASPMKDGPVAKRQAPVETGCDTATNAPQVSQTGQCLLTSLTVYSASSYHIPHAE